MSKNKKNIAIILASGSGERSGLSIPKQFLKVAGKMVINHTIDTFEKHCEIDEIVIVTNSSFVEYVREIVLKSNYKKVKKVLAGGATRRESSYIGISSIEEEEGNILIHDAVRPFLRSDIISDCINALDEYQAVDVAIPSADTLVTVDNNLIKEIPDRKIYRRGQTPQAFDLKLIRKAHLIANSDESVNVTDDCGLIINYNLADVFVVEGDDYNHKITYPIDVAIADKLFQMKSVSAPFENMEVLKDKVIVIFGASKGIGKSTLELAESYGAKVYGFSKSLGVNVQDYESVKNALKSVFDKEKHIDFVVNTVGLLKMGQLSCREIADIEDEIKTNYVGCVNVAMCSYEYLKESKGALLFYTSSSYTRGRALYSIYSSTKAAIVNFVQALAEEWEKDEIKVNVINPERTATPMRFSNFGKEPEGSLLMPEVVAEKTLNTLISDYTGQVIDVKKMS